MLFKITHRLRLLLNRISNRPKIYFPEHDIPRRVDSNLFFGRHRSDNFPLSQEVKNKLDSKEPFSKAAFLLIKHLGKVDALHPLWLNSDFMFIGPESSLHVAYKSIFEMCFSKTQNVLNPQSSSSSNHSGHYFVGPRGVGKSTMLKTCCLIVGQLLPNLASIYIDASKESSHHFREYLVTMLNDKAILLGKPHEELSSEADINEILCFAAKLNCSLALFVDEAHILVDRPHDWPDLLACISSFRSAVFLAGSDSVLVSCVKLRPQDRIHLKEKLGTDIQHQSLNTTKLSQWNISGFVTITEYQCYFQTRPHLWTTLCGKELNMNYPDNLEKEIIELHSLTGGRMGSMHALANKTQTDLSLILDFASISESDAKNLEPVLKQVKLFGKFDPFRMPAVAIGDGKDQISLSLAADLIDKKLLRYVSSETVTLSTPAVYHVVQSKPSQACSFLMRRQTRIQTGRCCHVSFA